MTDPFDNGYWVKADFARDLERRLAAATAEVDRLKGETKESFQHAEAEVSALDLIEEVEALKGKLYRLQSTLAATEQKLRECEADTKRLDWLERPAMLTIAATVGGWKFVGADGTIHIPNHNDGLRAAIDAAMSNPEKQQ